MLKITNTLIKNLLIRQKIHQHLLALRTNAKECTIVLHKGHLFILQFKNLFLIRAKAMIAFT